MREFLFLPLVAILALPGCADMSDSGRSAATGAAIGAVGGGLMGSLSGNAGWGAAIGAGVGGAGGYMMNRSRNPR